MNPQESAEFLDVNKNEWVTIFRTLGMPETAHYYLNSPTAERVLCVCRGGNCRSVAVSFLLKYKYMCDAVSVSLEKNGQELFRTLTVWADKIIVTEQHHFDECQVKIRISDLPKLILLDLGGMERLRARPFEIDFLKKVDAKLQEIGYGRTE